MLFPLTLTPFEYYYWCDDRSDYPTTFPIDLFFVGELKRDTFQHALHVALTRHPLLNALVRDVGKGIPVWIPSNGIRPQVEWNGASQHSVRAAAVPIDLIRSVGLRVWGWQASDRCRLRLLFHHCCCDALGAFQFIEDLLVAYHCLVEGMDAQSILRPLDPNRLRTRGDYGLSEENYRTNLRDVWTTLRVWARILLREPTHFAMTKQTNGTESKSERLMDYATHALPKDAMIRLRKVATRHGVSVNDLMLRDLFLTMLDWNKQHGVDNRQRLTVNVPVSLRLRGDRHMPAANVLGFWFVTRTGRDASDPLEMLQSIHEETEKIKKWRLPLFFMGGLAAGSRFPRLMRGVLRSRRSFATMVFSNTGRVLARVPLQRRAGKIVCGDVLLERVTGVPPIRPGTRAAMVVTTYAQETTMNLCCDRAYFDQVDARKFLDAFANQLLVKKGV